MWSALSGRRTGLDSSSSMPSPSSSSSHAKSASGSTWRSVLGVEGWDEATVTSFCRCAVRGFLRADLYTAMTEALSRAEGSFGLQAHCTLEPGRVDQATYSRFHISSTFSSLISHILSSLSHTPSHHALSSYISPSSHPSLTFHSLSRCGGGCVERTAHVCVIQLRPAPLHVRLRGTMHVLCLFSICVPPSNSLAPL